MSEIREQWPRRRGVDLMVRKVRLSPGSDRIADHSADPGCATSRHSDHGRRTAQFDPYGPLPVRGGNGSFCP